ncbi:sensor histidine kinase [Peptostreptococcus sp. MV1]|uniref:sensor histidine kinase n=1 Tax=Peptostreptococcus sp. MV1 TaxID=1219626 RepID=UPI000A4B6FA0|nr:HAMP domain-containing sensor histidine kinase [Peptostreptococcus sp. MV1]
MKTRLEKTSIKTKVFFTTSILALTLAILILSLVYLLLPPHYQRQKEENAAKLVDNICRDVNNKSFQTIKNRLDKVSSSNVMYISLMSPDSKLLYEKNEFLIHMNKYEEVNFDLDKITTFEKIRVADREGEHTLRITTIFYPMKDTADAIRGLSPMIIIIVILLSFLGSYIYSEFITSPLLKIIDMEQYQIAKRKKFIGAISHELKTPITIISGQLEGMIYNIGKFKDRDLYLKKCYDTTQDLKLLVYQMMELSKKEILDATLNRSYICLADIIESVSEKHRFLYEEKSINFSLNMKSKGYIYAYKDSVVTVMNNLISNAIKYTPEGYSVIIVLEEQKRKFQEPKIIFTIENTGVSLSKKELKNVFEPLYRVESSRNRDTGGSGLGLFFVGQILSTQGFSYEMFSRENSIVFRIEFNS